MVFHYVDSVVQGYLSHSSIRYNMDHEHRKSFVGNGFCGSRTVLLLMARIAFLHHIISFIHFHLLHLAPRLFGVSLQPHRGRSETCNGRGHQRLVAPPEGTMPISRAADGKNSVQFRYEPAFFC